MNSFKRARTTERSYDKLSPKDKKKYNLYKQGVAIDREEKAIARDEGRARKSFLGFGDVLNRRGKKIEQQELRARDNYDAASLGMERAIKAEEKFLESSEYQFLFAMHGIASGVQLPDSKKYEMYAMCEGMISNAHTLVNTLLSLESSKTKEKTKRQF